LFENVIVHETLQLLREIEPLMNFISTAALVWIAITLKKDKKK